MKTIRTIIFIILGIGLALQTCYAANVASCEQCSPEEYLERQNLLGQQIHDQELEKSALNRLALISGNDAPKFRLMMIRSQLNRGSNNRKEIEKLINDFCNKIPNTFECEQAQAIFKITSAEMRLRLQPFVMYETNGNYELASKEIENIFGGAPIEEGLRYRYFLILGHIAGREQEALDGLIAMGKADPQNYYLTRSTKPIINEFKANKLANEALAVIHDPQKSSVVEAKLAEALSIDPNNPDADYWKKRLNESKYYSYIQIADNHVDKKQYKEAIYNYQKALKILDNNTYAYIGLARCAIATENTNDFNYYKNLALKFAKSESSDEQLRIKNLMQSMKADVLIVKADKQEQQGQIYNAILLREQALKLDNNNPWIYYTLASNYRDYGDAQKGLNLFRSIPNQKLKQKEFAYPYALYLKSINMNDEAFNVLTPFKYSSDLDIKNELTSLEILKKYDELEQKAINSENDLDFANAINYREEIIKLKLNDDPWQYFNLASNFVAIENCSAAINVFNSLPENQVNTAEYAYPYALILEKCDKPTKALDVTEPYKDLENFATLRIQLKDQQISLKVNDLLQNNQEQKAIVLLQKASTQQSKIMLADIYFNNSEYIKAQSIYKEVINSNTLNNDNIYLKYALCETELNNKNEALQALSDYEQLTTTKTISDLIELAEIYERLDEEQKALQIYTQNHDQAVQNKSRESTWFLRNELRSNISINYNKDQLNLARTALAAADNQTNYNDDTAFTKAMLTPNNEEDWLHKSIRTLSEETYKKQMGVLTTGFSYLKDSGTPGYSDLTGQIYIVNVKFPLFKGNLQLQTDTVSMDEGKLSTEPWESMYGTCFSIGCSSQNKNNITRTSFAIAWNNDIYSFDIAALPRISYDANHYEWKNDNILGSLGYNFQFSDINAQIKLYKRAFDNSFLSYFGDYDPNTGKIFGAVRATGIKFTGSYALNSYDGIWGNIYAERILGKNVENNTDYRVMAGYYNHLLDLPNERISIGSTNTYWRFSHDLSGYTLGQGGYYSPQHYASTSVSLNWRKRTFNWSWEIQGSLNETWSLTRSADRYPNKGLIPNYLDLNDLNAKSDTNSSWSFGGNISALVERRLTEHLTIGGQITLTKSEDYEPNQGLIYVRYNFNTWLGDLSFPPTPPTPYTQW